MALNRYIGSFQATMGSAPYVLAPKSSGWRWTDIADEYLIDTTDLSAAAITQTRAAFELVMPNWTNVSGIVAAGGTAGMQRVAAAPMAFEIAANHQLHGANRNTNAGSSTYVLPDAALVAAANAPLQENAHVVLARPLDGLLAPALEPVQISVISGVVAVGAAARAEAAAAGQWHIRNTTPGQLDLNIGNIWDDYTGWRVRIGVYDSGVEATHPELNDNYNASLHFIGDNPTPDYTATGVASNDGHGTSVAGIIAAERNGTGPVGIAYNARITSVDTVGASTVSNWSDFAQGMSRFDIVNRSSGTSTQFQVDASNFANYETAIMQGRGGRGTIIVESAGNDRGFGDLNNNGTQEATDAARGNSNADSNNNGHFTIVVGSVDQNGNIDSYSSPGANLLVSAFGTGGAVVTTDLVGTNGYNTSTTAAGGDITNTFNGTSAATPMVSGIVALMLEANPMLGWRDVQNILSISARHVGSDIGAAPTGSEQTSSTYLNQSWIENRADNWNGGGMHFSNDYGYGLVDAHAAVRLAESWTLQSKSSNQQIGVGWRFGSEIQLQEGNILPHEFTIRINDNINTESIGLWMDLQHQRMSDLRIEIRSPEGTWNSLTNRTGLGGADFALAPASDPDDINQGWTFYSNAFRGERAQGDWVIRIWDMADSGAGDNGSVGNFMLRTYGSADTVNDQLYYTDEYRAVWSRAMAIGDYGRLQIFDGDGGTDTINAAATSTDAFINLEQGSISLIAGGYASVAMGTVIENAFGGDGNDTLYGNDQFNLLKGNRGNDTIYGRGGADSLSGDQGDDLLVGGARGDNINGGAGNDTASYEGSAVGVSVSLGDQQSGTWNGSARGGDATGDRLYYIENLAGSSFRDTLTGNDGDNVLNGAGGADTMVGRKGNDTYYVDNVNDVVDEQIWVGTGGGGSIFAAFRLPYQDAGSDRDLVVTTLGRYDLSATSSHNSELALFNPTGRLYGTIEDLTYGGSGNFAGIGNTSNNIIRGGTGSDNLYGGGGNDTLHGGRGNDGYNLGTGDDKAYIDNGTAVGGDVVDGSGGGYDIVYADDTTITGGLRLNLFGAGTGYTPDVNLVAFTSAAIDVDEVQGNAGNDVVDASRLTERIVILGNGGDDTVIGGVGNDALVGGDDNDAMRGGLGQDGYDLGLGNDSAYIDNGTAAGGDVVYGAAGGYDTVLADDNTIATGLRLNLFTAGTGYTSDVNQVAFTSAAIDVDKVVGNAGDDLVDASRLVQGDIVEFVGGAGMDTLISGAAQDFFDGEDGIDTIVFNGPQSDYEFRSVELFGVEVLTIKHIATGTTDFLRNVERAVFRSGGTETVVELNELIGKRIIGTDANDTLVGTALADTIEGLDGDDTLIGGAGTDSLIGGAGHDTFVVDNADRRIDGGTGYDYIRADSSIAVSGLRLSLAGTSVAYVDASNGADVIDATGTIQGTITEIDGHAGNDVVIDGAGETWFYGGDGTDTIRFSGNLADYTINPVATWWGGWTEITNNATNTVDWVIGVEQLQFADQTIDDPTSSSHITGTAGNDVLTGTDGVDVLNGGDGADQLRAGAGNDALYIDDADTVVDGGEGWDVVYATEAANQAGLHFTMAGTNTESVWSGMGNDVIDTRGLEVKPSFWYEVYSRAGDDTVIGGDNNLSIYGGAGNDTLVMSGNRADYTVAVVDIPDDGLTHDGERITLTHAESGIVNYVWSIENFQFDDGAVALSKLIA